MNLQTPEALPVDFRVKEALRRYMAKQDRQKNKRTEAQGELDLERDNFHEADNEQ